MHLKKVSAITLAAAMVNIAGCQTQDEGRFDPRAMGQFQREAAREVSNEPLRPLPTTLQSQFMSDRNDPNAPKEPPVRTPLAPDNRIYRLPLREIAQRAVAHNLNVQVAGYQPAIEESRVTEAEARFDPEFFAGATFTAARDANDFDNNGNADIFQSEIGLRQLLPSGGQAELVYRPAHYNFAGTATGFSNEAFWNPSLQLQITQPLLRDFGNDINRARIVINRLNQRISLLEWRRDLEELLLNTEQVYWRLVQAEQNQRILEQLLERTINTADILQARLKQDVTYEQVSNAVARVEAARADLIRARQRVRDLSDQLKALMNDPEFPVASNQLLLPADQPLQEPIVFDLAETISTALANRPDLGQQQLRVDSASVALEVAKNNRLPQLNLIGSIGTSGVGENAFNSTNNMFRGPDDNGSDLSWSLGFQFSQKLGNREANAIYRRASLQRMQAITQYAALIENATLEVKVAQRDVETSWQAIAQTRAARFAAAKALEVITTLQQGGEPLRPDFVERQLARQQELAQAEQAEQDAIAQYNIAIATLERRKGTLLRYNNVIIDEKPLKR